MSYPVSVSDACTHLHIVEANLTAEETTQLELMIGAATEHAENITKRVLTNTAQVSYHDCLPSDNLMIIRNSPLESLTIEYKDKDGADVVHPSGDYYTFEKSEMTFVAPVSGSFPETNGKPGNVKITYQVDVANVPKAIRIAILLIVGTLYENREDGVIEQGIVAVKAPLTARNLLSSYRMR